MKFQVELKYHLPAHKDCIYTCLKLTDTTFLTAGGDGLLLKWDLADTTSAHSIAKTDSSIYFLEKIDENTIVIGTNSGALYLINLKNKSVIAELEIKKGIFTGYKQGDYLYIGLADGELVKISLLTFRILYRKTISSGHIRKLSVIPKAQTLVAATSANEIIFIEDDLVKHLINNAHNDSVFSLFALDQHLLISGGKDAILKLWDLKSYQTIIEVPAHLFAINDITQIKSNNRIITASRDKSIKIWDPETLLLEKVMDRSKHSMASSHSVNKLTMLNSKNLVSVGDDRIVRVYEIKSI